MQVGTCVSDRRRGAAALAMLLMASAAMPAQAQTSTPSAATQQSAAAAADTQSAPQDAGSVPHEGPKQDLGPTTAAAPAGGTQAGQAPADGEAIVVTGSRIARNGYQAPTPLTVVTADAIAAGSATPNVANYLNTIPAFAGSAQPQGNLNATQSGNTRVNGLNLRNLGTTRTLLLVDGQRVVSSTQNGTSDLNSIPQQLISRVDIVTGGASAVYGSDAVAGVVNVILDHKFTGIKAEASANITDYGDNPGYLVQASAGFGFAGGRGHVILSGARTFQAGIEGDGGREWNRHAVTIITNPAYTATNGLPQFLEASGVGFSTSSRGGLIYSGPLRGVAFGVNGVPYQFNFGSIISPPYMVGGQSLSDQIRTDVMALENKEVRDNLLGRVEFDLTDSIKYFAQFSWSDPHLTSSSSNLFQPGSGPTIRIDNAYLPASVRAAAITAGVTTLPFGTQNVDLHQITGDTQRTVKRYTSGFSGDYRLFGHEWTWSGSYLYNTSRTLTQAFHNLVKDKFALATDAVVNPATGAIVCRSTLTNPTNGCVPLNVLGIGVATQAGIDYVSGTSYQLLNQRQEVIDASTTGTLFANWAGDVSLALSLAHRNERANTETNTATQAFLLANYGAINGRYTVDEGAVETVFPLLKKTGFVDAWDVNAAVRGTRYTTSGYVTTWKVGSTFATDFGVKLRGTISRDIRAPSINELFAAGNVTRAAVFDPFTNTNPTITSIQQGNPALLPEVAISKSVGIIVQPEFLRGFQASVDYFTISIKGAVTTLNSGNVINLCYQGNAAFCSQLTRDSTGTLSLVTTGVFNYAVNRTRGFDVEASYGLPAADIIPGLAGRFSLHANASIYLEGYINNGLTPATDTAGVIGQLSKFRTTVTANYQTDALSLVLTGRGFSGGLYAAGAIECSSGCPTSTTDHPTYDHASLPGAFYFDGSVSYTFGKGGDREWEGFFNAKNILGRDPPPAGNTNYYNANTLTGVYDYLGRVFRVGVRFRLK